MLATNRLNVNKKEIGMIVALGRYTVLALEEEIEKAEKGGCGDLEYLSGLYAKKDEAKEKVKYFRDLL